MLDKTVSWSIASALAVDLIIEMGEEGEELSVLTVCNRKIDR